MIFKRKSLLATIAAMFLGSVMFFACSDDDTPPPGTANFVAVTNITNVRPTGVMAGGSALLTVDVSPNNATRRDSITWSVVPASEYAYFSGRNTLNVSAASEIGSSITVRATIARGGADEVDIHQDFEIEVTGFIPVTSISLTSQEAATVGVPFTLSATVAPTNASNQTIVWTGNGVENGILTATEQGQVTVTATITNGRAEDEDFEEHFNITVNLPVVGFDPNAANVVLFDNFQVRSLTPDDPNSFEFTAQNALMLRTIGEAAGSWYAWEWNLAVTDHNEIDIVGVDGDDWADRVLGDGNLNAIIDAREVEGGYGGGIESPFFADRSSVDLRGLKTVRIKGELQGAVYITILTDAWNTSTVGGVWCWTISKSVAEMEPFELELDVNESAMGSSWGLAATGGDLATNLQNAIGLGINLNTQETDYAFFSISEIHMVFNDENAIPTQFGERLQPQD
jgi:hypothetical protein